MGKYFGTDGFRGEANVTLTVDHAFKVGRFLGWYYGKNHENGKAKIVIGKDTRRSSYMFEYSLVAGLTASGADAYLLHVTTTPSVSYVARTEDFDCGIMISASHNPFYDNGIKLINAAGEKMKQILERLTKNRFLGVGVGAAVTAVIQSSSATTVMVVGFVNSGMMTLRQAVWIIMGANIGTTITGQLIALDAGAVAPLLAFLGVVLILFAGKDRIRYTGEIVAGLGILFIGMDMMGEAMQPLCDSQVFLQAMTKFEHPLLGILAGAAFTAAIQSSSASVGILQTLAQGGAVSFAGAVYVLFGQNIGTCITAVLAAIGTGRNAKRTTIIHLLFNLIGTVVFTVLCMTTPLVSLVAQLTPGRPAAQIANMHTIFNIGTTLLLLPAGNLLTGMAEHLLPDKKSESLAAEQRKAACKKVEDVWNS